jgi:hypothetical protein
MESTTRLILIVGASACCVFGIKWMYWTIVYDFLPALPMAVFAFIPIILIAPRSVTYKRRLLFISLGLTEVIIITLGLTIGLLR